VIEKENNELRETSFENNNLRRKIAEYENRISILNAEMERLNHKLESRNAEVDKYRNVEYENQALKSQIKEL
jgi:uncharacterized small protein (DUF1192 family)